MHNVHAIMRPLLRIPGAPPPIEPDALQAARAQAWREVQQAEAANPNVLSALRDQQQNEQNLGLLS